MFIPVYELKGRFRIFWTGYTHAQRTLGKLAREWQIQNGFRCHSALHTETVINQYIPANIFILYFTMLKVASATTRLNPYILIIQTPLQ
jgi:hypothetical protein